MEVIIMKKTILSALLLTAGSITFAGLIDFGDETLNINFNRRALIASAARKVFPELSQIIP